MCAAESFSACAGEGGQGARHTTGTKLAHASAFSQCCLVARKKDWKCETDALAVSSGLCLSRGKMIKEVSAACELEDRHSQISKE